MKSIKALSITLLFLGVNTLKAQEGKHTFGLSYNVEKDESSIYLNEPNNVWAELQPSLGMQLFYYYNLNTYMKFGSYLEMTKAKIETYRTSNYDASRWNFGVQCLGKYPDWYVFIQGGAYVSAAIANSDQWDDSFSGLDYGIILGPAAEYKGFGIALHVHAGYSILNSYGSEPVKMWLHDRRLYLKLYYTY